MILRFYCCWDDTKRTFGQKLPFALHYFLRLGTSASQRCHSLLAKWCAACSPAVTHSLYWWCLQLQGRHY